MDDEKLYNLLDYIKPTNSFIDSAQPSKPDYSNMDNWAAYPQKNGQQFYTPDQSYTVNKLNNEVDVFYIHPTGFFEKAWNSTMDKSRSAYERTEVMLANQATAFNDSCNIYAPDYRQATYYSFFHPSHHLSTRLHTSCHLDKCMYLDHPSHHLSTRLHILNH